MTVAASDLRATLRRRRRELSTGEQLRAAQALAEQLTPFVSQAPPGIVAAYEATDGEISPSLVVEALETKGWQTAYPRVDESMQFHLSPRTSLVDSRWGLREPPPSAPAVDARELSLVLTPLVGFYAACNRLGRGRAYYDKAFAFLLDRPRPATGVLVGLAHDLQLVGHLEQGPHDVPLDAVATPTRIYGSMYAPEA